MKITVEMEPKELQELLALRLSLPVAAPNTAVRTTRVKAERNELTKHIRAWARDQGMAVAKGGNLPKDVIARYYEEH